MMRYIFTLALALLLGGNAFAQSPGWQWVLKKGVGNGSDCITDAAGNIYVAGGSGNALMPYIAKYNSQGQLIWEKVPGSTTSNVGQAYSLVFDHSGNIIVTGEFSYQLAFDSLSVSRDSITNQSLFVMKMDTAGAVKWLRSYGGQPGRGLAVDDANNIYLDGQITRWDTTRVTPFWNLPGMFGGFTARLDSNGAKIWVANSTCTMITMAPCALAADGSGNVFSAGICAGNVSFGGTTLHLSDSIEHAFLVKYNSSGAVQWAKIATGRGSSDGLATAMDLDGNVYLSGEFIDSIDFDGTSAVSLTQSNHSWYLTKFSPSGNLLWMQHSYAKRPDVYAFTTKIITDKKRDVYLTGLEGDSVYFNSNLLPTGKRSFYVAKFTASGQPVWAQNAWGNIFPGGISLDPNGDINVCGSVTEKAVFGHDTINGDVRFLAKLSAITGIPQTPDARLSWSVFPNPSNGTFSILTPILADAKIALLDEIGKTICTAALRSGSKETLDFTRLPNGIYFLQLRSLEGSCTKKLIIRH